jgi:hypothetical protein
MFHYYEIDIVPLHDDRVGAIFSPIIDKISNSQRLTELRLSDVSCHEFVVVILLYYEVNVTPPHEDREAARPLSICLHDIRFSGIHNASN